MTTLLTLLLIGLISALALRVLGYFVKSHPASSPEPGCTHRWIWFECGEVRTLAESSSVEQREEWPDVVG